MSASTTGQLDEYEQLDVACRRVDQAQHQLRQTRRDRTRGQAGASDVQRAEHELHEALDQLTTAQQGVHA